MRIKAAVTHAKGEPFVIQDVELDEPQSGEILVRIVASGICHTVLSKKFDKRFHVFVINFQRICQKVVLFSYVFGCLNVFISPKIPV